MFKSHIKTINDLDVEIQSNETNEDEKLLLDAIRNVYVKMEIASSIIEDKFKNFTNTNRILN